MDPRFMGMFQGMIPGGGMSAPPGFASPLAMGGQHSGPIPVDPGVGHGFGGFPGFGGFGQFGQGGNAFQGWRSWLDQFRDGGQMQPLGGQPFNMMQTLMGQYGY